LSKLQLFDSMAGIGVATPAAGSVLVNAPDKARLLFNSLLCGLATQRVSRGCSALCLALP